LCRKKYGIDKIRCRSMSQASLSVTLVFTQILKFWSFINSRTMYRKSKGGTAATRRTTRTNTNTAAASSSSAAALHRLPEGSKLSLDNIIIPTAAPEDETEHAASFRKRKKRPKQDQPVRKWVQVRRAPAPGITFTVPVWVAVENLTMAERYKYEIQEQTKQRLPAHQRQAQFTDTEAKPDEPIGNRETTAGPSMTELLVNSVSLEAAAPLTGEISAIDNASPEPPTMNLDMADNVIRILTQPETLGMTPLVANVITTIDHAVTISLPPDATANPTKPVLNDAIDHMAAVASHHDYQLESQIAVAATTPTDNDSIGSAVEMTAPLTGPVVNATEDPHLAGSVKVEAKSNPSIMEELNVAGSVAVEASPHAADIMDDPHLASHAANTTVPISKDEPQPAGPTEAESLPKVPGIMEDFHLAGSQNAATIIAQRDRYDSGSTVAASATVEALPDEVRPEAIIVEEQKLANQDRLATVPLPQWSGIEPENLVVAATESTHEEMATRKRPAFDAELPEQPEIYKKMKFTDPAATELGLAAPNTSDMNTPAEETHNATIEDATLQLLVDTAALQNTLRTALEAPVDHAQSAMAQDGEMVEHDSTLGRAAMEFSNVAPSMGAIHGLALLTRAIAEDNVPAPFLEADNRNPVLLEETVAAVLPDAPAQVSAALPELGTTLVHDASTAEPGGDETQVVPN
jgi:hypothetical protein